MNDTDFQLFVKGEDNSITIENLNGDSIELEKFMADFNVGMSPANIAAKHNMDLSIVYRLIALYLNDMAVKNEIDRYLVEVSQPKVAPEAQKPEAQKPVTVKNVELAITIRGKEYIVKPTVFKLLPFKDLYVDPTMGSEAFAQKMIDSLSTVQRQANLAGGFAQLFLPNSIVDADGSVLVSYKLKVDDSIEFVMDLEIDEVMSILMLLITAVNEQPVAQLAGAKLVQDKRSIDRQGKGFTINKKGK